MTPIIDISKEYTFDAAHMLPLHQGKCRNLHGHTYKVRVTLSGEVRQDGGMVLDFGVVSQIMKPIIESYDHSFIAGTWEDDRHLPVEELVRLCIDEANCWKVRRISYPHTTAEYIAVGIRDEFIVKLREWFYQYKLEFGTLRVSVTVWETPTSSATTDWSYV